MSDRWGRRKIISSLTSNERGSDVLLVVGLRCGFGGFERCVPFAFPKQSAELRSKECDISNGGVRVALNLVRMSTKHTDVSNRYLVRRKRWVRIRTPLQRLDRHRIRLLRFGVGLDIEAVDGGLRQRFDEKLNPLRGYPLAELFICCFGCGVDCIVLTFSHDNTQK